MLEENVNKILKKRFFLTKKILIATGNKGKFTEISNLLLRFNKESISPSKDLPEPEETGSSFLENSFLKAKFYALKSSLISLADDSGLCVEALNNAPGIHSARFSLDEHGNKNFPLAFKKIEESLKNSNINPCGCKAHFICNLTLFDPQNNISVSFEGRIDGTLTFPARGNKGFGYDPIFIKNSIDQTFGEIDPLEKDKISHRAVAFEKLLNYLNEPS